jgi:hypothetical protein
MRKQKMRSLEKEKNCIQQGTTMKRRGRHAKNPMVRQQKEFNVQKNSK